MLPHRSWPWERQAGCWIILCPGRKLLFCVCDDNDVHIVCERKHWSPGVGCYQLQRWQESCAANTGEKVCASTWSCTTATKESLLVIRCDFVTSKGWQTSKETDQRRWHCTEEIFHLPTIYPVLLVLMSVANVHFQGTCLQIFFRSPHVHTLESMVGQQSPLICGQGLPSLFYTHSVLPGWSSSSGGGRCFHTFCEAAKIKKYVSENELNVMSKMSPYPSLGPFLCSDFWGAFVRRLSDDLPPLTAVQQLGELPSSSWSGNQCSVSGEGLNMPFLAKLLPWPLCKDVGFCLTAQGQGPFFVDFQMLHGQQQIIS